MTRQMKENPRYGLQSGLRRAAFVSLVLMYVNWQGGSRELPQKSFGVTSSAGANLPRYMSIYIS